MKPAALIFLPLLLILGGTSCRPATEVTESPLPSPLSLEQHAAALQQGQVIVAETFSLLSSNLQSAIRSGGVSNALPFCSVAALPLTTRLAGKHGVAIRRLTHKPRNPVNRADGVESTILDHFRTSGVETNPPAPVVTNLNAATLSYFAPIVLNNELCLKCHGEPGVDIAPEDLAIIQRLYPQDRATGFRLGDFRGAWRVDLPVAQLHRN
ncbi:MAG: DUF3365 domain-containing protein [Verrucomicrobiae bacterium]|nr:DUF3365 domain-containing protein [Verrucomicrobiae bacterium]